MATLQSMVMAVNIAGITVLSRGVEAQILPERRITAGVLQLTHRFEALRRAPQWALTVRRSECLPLDWGAGTRPSAHGRALYLRTSGSPSDGE